MKRALCAIVLVLMFHMAISSNTIYSDLRHTPGFPYSKEVLDAYQMAKMLVSSRLSGSSFETLLDTLVDRGVLTNEERVRLSLAQRRNDTGIIDLISHKALREKIGALLNKNVINEAELEEYLSYLDYLRAVGEVSPVDLLIALKILYLVSSNSGGEEISAKIIIRVSDVFTTLTYQGADHYGNISYSIGASEPKRVSESGWLRVSLPSLNKEGLLLAFTAIVASSSILLLSSTLNHLRRPGKKGQERGAARRLHIDYSDPEKAFSAMIKLVGETASSPRILSETVREYMNRVNHLLNPVARPLFANAVLLYEQYRFAGRREVGDALVQTILEVVNHLGAPSQR